MQRHHLKKPEHWCRSSQSGRSQEKLDRAIESKWQYVNHFETRLAFAQDVGVSVSKFFNWMKAKRVARPAHWKNNMPRLDDVKALWPKAASYKSQADFVRDNHVSQSSVLRAVKKYSLPKPKHWPEFPKPKNEGENPEEFQPQSLRVTAISQ